MAKAPFERRDYARGGHAYFVDGVKVPGVTTVLGKAIPKHLEYWSAELVATFAADHPEHFAAVPRTGMRDAAKSVFQSASRDAADRGTALHGLVERFNRREPIDVPPEHDAALANYERWFADFDVAPVYVEASVFSLTWRYAGTVDLIAYIEGGNALALIDLKTGNSGIWPETALQLGAYENAEWVQPAKGAPVEPMPRVDLCAALWLQDDRYEFRPLDTGPRAFGTFLHAMALADFADLKREEIVGDPLTPWSPEVEGVPA